MFLCSGYAAHTYTHTYTHVGKSWTLFQIAYLSAVQAEKMLHQARTPLFPTIIFVQKLANLIREGGKDVMQACQVDFVHFYLTRTVEKPQRLRLLLQLYRARSLLVMVDGIDEASDLKAPVVDLVITQLAEGGHHFVVTTRPSGVDKQAVNKFKQVKSLVLDLQPLSQEQQQKVLQQQLRFCCV
jgi:hypothetical protein